MAKMRVHELAKELTRDMKKEISSKDIQSALALKGIAGKTASSNIEDKEIELVKKFFSVKKEEKPVQEKAPTGERKQEKEVDKKVDHTQGSNNEHKQDLNGDRRNDRRQDQIGRAHV